MNYLDHKRESDNEVTGAIVGLVALIAGGLIIWSIGEERAWDEASVWAVLATRHCEASYRAEGFPNVTECLKGAFARREEVERQQKQADGPLNPRG